MQPRPMTSKAYPACELSIRGQSLLTHEAELKVVLLSLLHLKLATFRAFGPSIAPVELHHHRTSSCSPILLRR